MLFCVVVLLKIDRQGDVIPCALSIIQSMFVC